MKVSKKASLYGVIIFFLIFIAYIFLSEKYLKKEGIVLNAKTTTWCVVVKGYDLNYEFYYEGKKKTANNAVEKIRGLREFEDKNFPAIYDPKYGASQILIDPGMFKKYNVPFPDSLKWVLPYFK